MHHYYVIKMTLCFNCNHPHVPSVWRALFRSFSESLILCLKARSDCSMVYCAWFFAICGCMCALPISSLYDCLKDIICDSSSSWTGKLVMTECECAWSESGVMLTFFRPLGILTIWKKLCDLSTIVSIIKLRVYVHVCNYAIVAVCNSLCPFIDSHQENKPLIDMGSPPPLLPMMGYEQENIIPKDC